MLGFSASGGPTCPTCFDTALNSVWPEPNGNETFLGVIDPFFLDRIHSFDILFFKVSFWMRLAAFQAGGDTCT